MFKRRRLLQGLTAGALVAPFTAGGARAQGLGTDYDVVIIGAGVAGLTAAEQLLSFDAELKVLVLEARDRIGGRVYSLKRDELARNVELGPYSISPAEGAAWSPINRFGLNVTASDSGQLELFPGVGALTEALADSAAGKAQLNSEVTQVFWREGLVGINYRNRGLDSAVTARRLIFSLPAAVVASGGPQFTPDLAPAKRAVAASLPRESGLSVAILFPASSAEFIDNHREWRETNSSSTLRAYRAGYEGEVLVEAQYFGTRADALAGQSDALITSLVMRSVGKGLSQNPSPSDAIWSSVKRWEADPLSRGARAAAGSTADHLTLAESQGNTLFFAGDSTCDPADVGTVHGAYASGQRAAREVALSLDVAFSAPDANEPILELF
ncbi:MAG: hypothetical protein Cons2KO_20540 [Congregibacter sp.]